MSNNKKGNRYTEDFKKQLYELNQNGSPVYKLSTEYGIPSGTIYKWISELKPLTTTDNGLPVKKKKWTLCANA